MLSHVAATDKPLVWLHGEIKTPPFSSEARVEAGWLLRRLQAGQPLSMPVARPMPSIGPRCLELRVQDRDQSWRIVCRVDGDAIVIVEVFPKRTRATPTRVIDTCQRRLRSYDAL